MQKDTRNVLECKWRAKSEESKMQIGWPWFSQMMMPMPMMMMMIRCGLNQLRKTIKNVKIVVDDRRNMQSCTRQCWVVQTNWRFLLTWQQRQQVFNCKQLSKWAQQQPIDGLHWGGGRKWQTDTSQWVSADKGNEPAGKGMHRELHCSTAERQGNVRSSWQFLCGDEISQR